MTRKPQLDGAASESAQMSLSERISHVFGDQFSVLDRLQSVKKVTPNDEAALEDARIAIVDLERRGRGGMEEADRIKIGQMRQLLDSATVVVATAEKAADDDQKKGKKGPTRKEKDALRKERRAAAEAAPEPAAEETEGAGGEQALMASFEQIADQWSGELNGLEQRLEYFDRWFLTFRDQNHAIAVADQLVDDIGVLGEDIVYVLSNLRIPIQIVDDVPERLRESVIRYNAARETAEENQVRAQRYDELVAKQRRELEERGREAEQVAGQFITSCEAIQVEIAEILALPHETPEERYIARARLEGFVRAFKIYNEQWDSGARPHLPDGERWLPVWTKALEAHRAAHQAYKAIQERRDKFRSVSTRDWIVNSQHFSARLDVIRVRLIAVQTLRGKEREDELAGIKEYYIGVRKDWEDLRSQVSRDLQQEDGSPVKVLGRVVRGIGTEIEALLSEKDARVLRAQEAYGELGYIAVRSLVCWNDKTLAQRGAFLRRYLNNEVRESDPEFGEFVRNRDVFIELVAPLAAAKNEIYVQDSRRRASAEQREKNQRRRDLRHPWLFKLRADRADLMDRIIEGQFWNQETAIEERRRLIRLGGRLNDNDPDLVAAVQSVDRDIPTFRRAVTELEVSKQNIIAFEDRLLTDKEEPVVPIDVAQLQRLAKEYSLANGVEYDALRAILELDGWKIPDVEARRQAVGEYWRYPNRQTAATLTDNPDAFRGPLDAWRAAVEQKLNRRDAFRWALERNRELISSIGRLSPSAQKTVDMVLASANTSVSESVAPPVRAPEALDARGEAIDNRLRDIGDRLADDMFWDPSIPRPTRFVRINAMLRRKTADARLKSNDGLRNVAEFYDAAGFTSFADLEARIERLRAALTTAAPTGDAAVAAVASAPAPAAATTAAVPVARNVPPAPAPASVPKPALVTRPAASRLPSAPTVAISAPSGPASIATPASAVAAAGGAARMLERLNESISARRAGDPVSAAATESVPPPLPEAKRVAEKNASPVVTERTDAPAPERTTPRATPESVRAALPQAPTLVRRSEPVRVAEAAAAISPRLVPQNSSEGGSSEASRSEVGSGPELAVTGAPAPIDAARAETAIGGTESVASSDSRLAPAARPPMRRELPPPPALTNEIRVSSWAKSIRNTVGRWFGRDLGDYVASELTGEQMERERQNQIMGRPEAVARTASSFMGIAGRLLGFQALVDVPRYFTQSFIKENERALLRAEILEAMEHEAQGRATGREGDRQRASLEASTRLERAINTSAHLTADQKAEMITRVNTMRTTYQERSFEVAEARSKELAEMVEANVQAKVNGWRAAKETVNSALAVLSFGGAPLVAGIGYGAARGVSYLAMSLQEKYVAAAVQNPRSSWVGKVQATFRDTWTSTWNRLSAPTETVGQRLMNAVDALAEIGNAVGVQTRPAISGLERSLPALRSLEGSTDSGIAQIVANAQQAIQAAIDRLLPVFERLTARQGSNPATT